MNIEIQQTEKGNKMDAAEISETSNDEIDSAGSENDIDDEDEESDNELVDYGNIDSMEKVNFDFEAFPPDLSDLEGIVDLITQVGFFI